MVPFFYTRCASLFPFSSISLTTKYFDIFISDKGMSGGGYNNFKT